MTLEREAVFRLLTERGGDDEAFKAVSEELDRTGDSAERAREVMDKLGELDVGEELRNDLGGLEAPLEEFLTVWDQFVRELEHPIDLAIPQAQLKVEEFARAVEEGGSGVVKHAGRAREGLDKLREVADKLEKEGHGLTDAQVAELRQLEQAYEDVTRAAGRARSSQNQARQDIKDQARSWGDLQGSIGGLGDLLSQLNPKMATGLGRLNAYGSALSAGAAAGSEFRTMLGDLDRALGTNLLSSFDETVKRVTFMQEAMDALVGATPDVVAQSEELRNAYHQLRAEGIDPAGMSLEQARQRLLELRQEQGETRRETALLQAATEEWAKGLGLSADVIEQEASRLADILDQVFAENPGLDTDAVGAKIEDQVRAMLDGLKALGVPADNPVSQLVQGIADEFKILDSETEAFVQKAKGHYAELSAAQREAFGLPGKLGPDAKAELAGLNAAFDDLDFQGVTQEWLSASDEQRESMKQWVADNIAEARRLGGELTPAMQEAATALGVIVPAWEPVRQGADSSSDALTKAARAAIDAEKNLSQLGTGAADAGRGMQDGGEAAKAGADAFAAAGAKAKEGAEGAKDGAKALDTQQTAAEGVKTEVAAAAEAMERLKTAQDDLTSGEEAVVQTLSSIGTSATDLVAALEGLPDSLSGLQSKVSAALAPIKTDLDAILAKAKEVNAELDRIEAGGGDGGTGEAEGSAAA